MYFFTVIAFAALPFLVAAVPVSPNSSPVKGPRSFSLTKHSNHLNRHGFVDPRKLQAAAHQTRAKYDRAFSAYEKRTGETHRLALNRKHSDERRSSNESSLADNSNILWTLDVTVGSPGSIFSVQLDTSTPDMFLSGVSCLTCFEHKRYDISLSSTAKDLKNQSTLNGLLGPVTGEIVSDMISAGGANVNMVMVAATKIDLAYQFPAFPGADGVMGMGLKGASSIGENSFFENAIASNALQSGEEKVFGMVLSPFGTGAKFIFGGRDTSKFVNSLTYTKLANKAIFWEIPLDSVKVNGKDIQITIKEAVIDSASTVIEGDSKDIANLYSNIPGSAPDPKLPGRYTIPCNTTVPVSFTFNGKEFIVTPPAFNLGPVDATGILCHGGFSAGPAVQAKTFWIMGSVFMENFYVEFDEGNLRIGLANSK